MLRTKHGQQKSVNSCRSPVAGRLFVPCDPLLQLFKSGTKGGLVHHGSRKRAPSGPPVAERKWMPLERAYMQRRSFCWLPPRPEMGPPERMSLGRGNMPSRSLERSLRGPEMGKGQWMPMEHGNLPGILPNHAAMASGERMP